MRPVGRTRRIGVRGERAFTLLEVLVALALSTLLLAAVYVALDLHWKYSTAGRDEVERSQIARALFNRLELDLRSIVYRKQETTEETDTGTTGTEPPPDSSSTDATSDIGTVDDSEESSMALDPTDPENAQGSGLFGNAGTLMVHISQPSRTLEYLPLGGGVAPGHRTSDLQTVSWFLARQGAGGLQGAVAELGEGLTRSSGDRLATQLADEAGDLSALASQSQLLASEVTALRFQYFDGAAWRPDWDSDALGGLPRAVEITLEIRASSAKPSKTESPPRAYSVVVLLPIAKPLAY